MPNVQFREEAISVKKYLSYSNGRYILKYVAEKDRWSTNHGSQYMSSKVKFLDEDNVEVTVTTVSSDNYGEPVYHIYSLKVVPSVDPIIQKAARPYRIFPTAGFVTPKEELTKEAKPLEPTKSTKRRIGLPF